MSKATVIRKKALDLVRQQDWQGAIKEYRRLVEMDQSNPNVHNELADIYLKTGSKPEAYDSFVRAIDEYARVGLFNNAVAVAKKVMRVLPGRTEVFAKLGHVRMRQGLAKEAESYYMSFLEKAAKAGFEPVQFAKIAEGIAEDMPESSVVLQRLAQCLLSYKLDDEAGNVLIKLCLHMEKNGDGGATAEVLASIESLGVTAKLDAARKTTAPAASDRTVLTEENIWTHKHSEGDRIEIESTPRFAPSGTKAPAAPDAPAAPADTGPSARDQYLLRLARGVGGSSEPAKPAQPTPPPAQPTPGPQPPRPEASAQDGSDPVPTHKGQRPPVPLSAATHPHPRVDAATEQHSTTAIEEPVSQQRDASGHMQISALIDDDADGGEGEDDYRSHYDLGMAYLEMDLLPEAIREYQMAARSPQYQVKCLEMIGLCFIKQKQPQLAIKQLTKGLALIGDESDESLGIKYNLGLAYEMVGDAPNARAQFEDVYVVDVTFRDVAVKLRNLPESG